jgi:hypothetical protein
MLVHLDGAFGHFSEDTGEWEYQSNMIVSKGDPKVAKTKEYKASSSGGPQGTDDGLNEEDENVSFGG